VKRVLIALVMFAGCGGEPQPGLQVGFKMHALKCERTDMQARIQVQVEGGYDCPLTVNPDRTVHGRCPSIPTGAIREFRLIYFAEIPGQQNLDLATALTEADLRGWTREEVAVEFPQASVSTDIDDDSDGMSNIVEWCTMQNPRGP